MLCESWYQEVMPRRALRQHQPAPHNPIIRAPAQAIGGSGAEGGVGSSLTPALESRMEEVNES
jgi:hypothetical protein